jgi:TolB-like protein/Tfp pilus assembly protein PilF
VSETRKLAAILVSDVVGYSRLTGADEDRILARLRALRSDLIDPTIAVHHGRVVKRTGDGAIVEFRSVVDAVRCALEVQTGMVERNAGLPPEKRIEYRVGIHLGDVVEETDGDLMGDGVNIAVRLEGVCESGGVCLSEDAYRQVRDRLKEPFVDLGEKALKNIARPVRVYALTSGSAGAARTSKAEPERSELPRRSLVVLPFGNIGGVPEQEYFVDGITESLTTDLSRISGAFVIGHSTAFSYKGKSPDLKQVGRELNVRYVLEGSVQRSGNRMRVNVQLIEAETGGHLWADRFDKPVSDFFDMQDEIVARLANALNAQLVFAEARRAQQAPNPDSMDLYFQGMSAYNRGVTPSNLLEARTLFERALALDPGNVDAIVGAALVNGMFAGAHMSDDRATHLGEAEALAVKALSIAPDNALAHLCLGVAQIFTNRAAHGIQEFERALAIDRNLVAAHAYIGMAKNFVGRGDEAAAHIEDALRLSPRDSAVYLWRTFNGSVKIFLAKDEEAIGELRRAIEANRNYAVAHLLLAVALAGLERLEEGRLEAREALSLDPTFTIRRYRADVPSDNPVFLAGRPRVYELMRRVGIPER